MNLISLDGVAKSLGEGPLFEGVSFGLDSGERVGCVGPNGAGKSTLLALLAGRMECDEGTIARQRSLAVNVLDQSPRWLPGDTVRDFLYRSDDPLVALVGRYEAALAGLHGEAASASARAAAEKSLASLTHDMEARGGFGLEHRFASLATELGLDDLSRPMAQLSGGMAKKAALARLLAPSSDLLLLDEPTNHLDLDAIEWLEKKLVDSGTAFVLVTHDRWFLDSVCTAMLEIDRRRVNKFAGGYADYLERLAERSAVAAGRERRRESILRTELKWLARGPKARGGKDKKRKERIFGLIDGRPEAAAAGSAVFQTCERRLGGKVLELEGVAKAWPGRPVLVDFSRKLSKGERIGVVGPNGSGKTTLLELIAGRTEPDAGRIERGATVAVGYFRQSVDGLDGTATLIDFVRAAAERIRMNDGVELSAEQFLERFGFPRAMHGQAVGKLSGGELRRLLLVRLLIAAPNVLLLDEPTNDFDIPTIGLLEEFLADFSGCLIAVSHDRAFLEGVVDGLWVLDGSGRVEPFVGSYAAWREAAAAAASGAAAEAAGDAKAAAAKAAAAAVRPSEAKTGGKLSFKEKREFEALLPEIDALEAEKAELERAFAAGAGGLSPGSAAYQEGVRRYGEIGTLIEAKTLRWEELAAR